MMFLDFASITLLPHGEYGNVSVVLGRLCCAFICFVDPLFTEVIPTVQVACKIDLLGRPK